jgi:hypothetical protein
MSSARFTAAPVLADLKDFQRQTVDYVFERLYGAGGSGRFLVADEVGLGKTMVARGVIARTLEHLQGSDRQVNIIYVCSNAAIAAQNVKRLNISGQRSFAIASRLTLLPSQVQQLASNPVNFVSFTPDTTFDLKSRSGIVRERALLYRMLAGEAWIEREGLLNLLQGAKIKRGNWMWWVEEERCPIDAQLAASFRAAVAGEEALRERLARACQRFVQNRQHVPHADAALRNQLIGELRHRLARTCLEALKPDLVILDEFQRFRDLLDHNNDAAALAQELFHCAGVRTLLLSATPYKMLSLDHEQGDDHYPDFLRTLQFLHGADDAALAVIRRALQAYRDNLFALASDERPLLEARDQLQAALLRVMCRTERVALSQRLDAMLVEPPLPAPLLPDDLAHAAAVDRAARAVGAREPLEYWKSSPYLFNFIKHYELRHKIDAASASPPAELFEALRAEAPRALSRERFNRYEQIEAGNARLRVLFADTLDRGLWRLLWLPPSLPYTRPAGPYADMGGVTKALVFSAWSVAPDAIAALCSYEAERRMVEAVKEAQHASLYEQIKPLLRFGRGREGRLTGMPTLAWLLPSAALAEVVDPLALALQRSADGSPPSVEELLRGAAAHIQRLLARLPVGERGARPDTRWYWAAPLLLEQDDDLATWCKNGWGKDGWGADEGGHEPGERFKDHVAHLLEVTSGPLKLGPRPGDLARVLAELALAGPGVCALRSLRRVAPKLKATDPRLLDAAARISWGFRALFNLPETIALLRGNREDSYWRLALQYALDGNLQALLDEQVHVLVEQLGLTGQEPGARVEELSRGLASALSLRTAQLQLDELRPGQDGIERHSFNTRCRFALRFADLSADQGAITRADSVRQAFNSPFRPFVLASTSIGQEGLDFHTWCHAVVHWNLPSNPVDLEQREGRVHRYKGHAVRKNIAARYGLAGLAQWDQRGDPWAHLFLRACQDRAPGASELVPFWIYEGGDARIERRVPLIPFSREVGQLHRLKRNLALYRLVFGQPRQEDLLAHLTERLTSPAAMSRAASWQLSLSPPRSQEP